MIVDHVIGVSARAAGAVAAERTVHVGREVVREIWDLKAALQTGLPAHDTHFPNSSFLDVALNRGIEEDRQGIGGGQWCCLLQGARRCII